jgi:hypothetical protein
MRLLVPEDFSALGRRIPSFGLDLWIFRELYVDVA